MTINHAKRVNLREFILGGQDGLVNVLGLVLGVASATSSTSIVIISGVVATVAESVSMAAVAYTSSNAAKDYFNSMLSEEEKVREKRPRIAESEIREVYYKKGFRGNDLNNIVKKICKNKKMCVETMLFEEHKITPEGFSNPLRSAWVVGISTILGSLIPLVPFFFFSVKFGIVISLLLAALFLFIVGALKAKLSIGSWKRSGIELMIIGLVAALVGYGVGLLLKGYGAVT